jgi:trk system potassium uptake protein TrkH
MVTNFTSIASCINNVGPGLERVGPTANFAFLSDISKLTLTFDMIAGRLELFPMLILFNPQTYKN